jgi:hypothetical protein
VFVFSADLNRDHALDLVVSELSKVSVLLGKGDGTFGPSQLVFDGPGPVAAVGDINGDHIPDLAVADNNGTLTILLGNGDGTFHKGTQSPIGPIPAYVLIGDYNHDGKADVVVSNYGGNAGSNDLYVLIGNGDGTFQPAVLYPVFVGWNLAHADFNGDGNADLVVTDYARPEFQILFGNGDGTFQAPVTYQTTHSTNGANVVDLNRDGYSDLIFDDYHSSTFTILLGDGHGGFQTPVDYPVPNSFNSGLTVGDFNGDGSVDVAVGSFRTGTVYIFLGDGSGSFNLQTQTFSCPYSVDWMVRGDFNGDGKSDLAVSSVGPIPPGIGYISILLNSTP